MQKDFHYYTVFILARYAGFSADEAKTIAYASQYVDDATEGDGIDVGGYIFDPVRTAHRGLYSFTWGIQRKIFIPFHFLPPGQLRPLNKKFSYITRPGSDFALSLIKEVKKDVSCARLHRLGIALHTFADTWSHQKFSGRQFGENNVDKLMEFDNGRWCNPSVKLRLLDYVKPVGHLQCDVFPDYPFMIWRYLNSGNKPVIRDNTAISLEAAKKIYGILRGYPKKSRVKPVPWRQIEPGLKKSFSFVSKNCDERCKNIEREFGDVFTLKKYIYDKTEWRRKALKPAKGDEPSLDWDDFPRDKQQKLRFERKRKFFTSDWVLFHQSAFQQRTFVLGKLM